MSKTKKRNRGGKKHGERKLRRKNRAEAFLKDLESNELSMGEGAAMMVTCEQYGLTWEDGHALLADNL